MTGTVELLFVVYLTLGIGSMLAGIGYITYWMLDTERDLEHRKEKRGGKGR